MAKKKIAETINVRINVGNFQHIEISKYAEKEIEYDNNEEMIQKEDELTQELMDNIIRNMRKIPDKLGKETKTVEEFEDKVSKTLPDFMKGSEEPNLAKKKVVKAEAEEKENVDKEVEKAKSKEKVVEDLVDDTDKVDDNKEPVVETIDEDDLFKM